MKPLAILLLLATLTACSEPTSGPAPVQQPEAANTDIGVIRGTVNYRERVALSNQAELEVRLEDVSRQDVAAEVIAEKRVEDPGQVPIRFELQYPLAAIDPGRSYAMRLRIKDGGRLRFINDSAIPVLTRGAGKEVRATLKAVGDSSPDTAAKPTHGAALRGQFRYLADAALFTDCRNGKAFPVAMEGNYIELERAYLNSGIEGGQPLTVEVVGRFLERPAMEGNRNEVNLIVDEFKRIVPDETCVPSANAELAGTYWKLLDIGGEAVSIAEGQDEPHFLLSAQDNAVRGSGGCNRFFGSYETGGDALSFSDMGATMKACMQGMETEQALLEVLSLTDRFEINGLILTLFAEDTPLARFEAVYL